MSGLTALEQPRDHCLHVAGEGGRDARVVQHGHAYLERAARAIHRALTRAAALGEIEEAQVGSRSELLVGLVLGINLVARSGVGRARLSALVAAVHREIADWRR